MKYKIQKFLKILIESFTLVDSNSENKLDNYLNGFYAKKRISQISLRRLSAGNYEYGSQKIHIKIEGETIRGFFI